MARWCNGLKPGAYDGEGGRTRRPYAGYRRRSRGDPQPDAEERTNRLFPGGPLVLRQSSSFQFRIRPPGTFVLREVADGRRGRPRRPSATSRRTSSRTKLSRLTDHYGFRVSPISIPYKKRRRWEIPPAPLSRHNLPSIRRSCRAPNRNFNRRPVKPHGTIKPPPLPSLLRRQGFQVRRTGEEEQQHGAIAAAVVFDQVCQRHGWSSCGSIGRRRCHTRPEASFARPAVVKVFEP